jgi:hypothetical protein
MDDLDLTYHFIYSYLTLVDPRGRAAIPLRNTLWEPESNLLLCRLDTVGAVANVTSNLDTEVATNSAHLYKAMEIREM